MNVTGIPVHLKMSCRFLAWWIDGDSMESRLVDLGHAITVLKAKQWSSCFPRNPWRAIYCQGEAVWVVLWSRWRFFRDLACPTFYSPPCMHVIYDWVLKETGVVPSSWPMTFPFFNSQGIHKHDGPFELTTTELISLLSLGDSEWWRRWMVIGVKPLEHISSPDPTSSVGFCSYVMLHKLLCTCLQQNTDTEIAFNIVLAQQVTALS